MDGFGHDSAVFGMVGLAFRNRAGSANSATRTVAFAQGEAFQTVGLLAPILAALLTSRLAVRESSERMNFKWRSLGQGATGRFLATSSQLLDVRLRYAS